ncbi:MAG: tetratricopeptide repeat protein [bacterium]
MRSHPVTDVALLVLIGLAGCAGPNAATLAPYREMVKQNPESAEAHYELGSAALAVEEYKLAKKEFRRVLELEPDHEQARLKKARSHEGLSEYMEACEIYRVILEQDPEHREANIGLGNVDMVLIMDFEMLGSMWFFGSDSRLTRIQYALLDELGLTYEEMMGIYQEAMDTWRKMVRLEERNAEFWCNLGVIANLTNNFDGARISFEQALKHKPDALKDREFLTEVYSASMGNKRWVPDVPWSKP